MAGLANHFPSQTIPEHKKDNAWKSLHLDWSEAIYRSYGDTREKMTRMMNVYNGIRDPQSIEWLTKRYGQVDKSPFIKYRMGRVKIDVLHGEFLKLPLVAKVTTVNSKALSEKQRQQDFIRAAMIMRKELEDVKNIAGVDVMEGVPIPESQEVFEKMNFKEKCEDVMNIILNQQIPHLDLKRILADCFKFLELTDVCGAKIELDERGKVKVWGLDPRSCIFESVQSDPYAEITPVWASLIPMPVHMVLMRYDLTKEQIDVLEEARANYNEWIGATGKGRGFMSYANGELIVDVLHMEWRSVTPLHSKLAPKTASQKMIDPDGDDIDLPLDAETYSKNMDSYDKREAKGEFKIKSKYLEERYEATRIGGVIDVNMRKVPKKRSIDRPSEIMSTTYVFYKHGEVNGTSVPLQQMMENFDNLYDVVRYILNRELSKVKGKLLTIDRAAVDKQTKLLDMLHRMVNDQILEYDSSAAGNISGRQLDPAMMFREIDLGLSDSFQQLLAFKEDLRREIDLITGISPNRMGETAASSTATAQQTDITNSRTVTQALFYGMSGFVRRVLKAVVDKSAISYAYYQRTEGEEVLGSERFSFLKDMTELMERDYAVHIEDGSMYAELSGKIEAMMQVSLNAGELRPMDAMNVLLAETLAQKKQFLIQGWEQVQMVADEMAAREQQTQAQMQQAQLATQVQLSQEDREDRQQADIQKEVVKGQVQMQVDDNKAQNEMHKQNLSQSHEINMIQPDTE